MAALSSKLVKEWHIAKNQDLKLGDLKSKSNKKVWWQCEKGHEWESTISNRSVGNGCPFCSGLRAIEGETDLATVNPILAVEWHPTKNGNLKPENVKAGSKIKVWWLCSKHHEWEAAIHSRNKKGCPYCSGNLVIKGVTDLETVNPTLAMEWSTKRNGTLKPHEISSQSHKIVWWQCKEGHEWQRSVHGRSNKSGCPYCSGRFAIKGKTDLETVNPRLAKEWHQTKNGEVKPEDVTIGSHTKIWWQCGKGHEWIASIYSRNNQGCPSCSGLRVIEGETDLVTINPQLSKEWHPTKNGNLKPQDVTAKSNKKAWWICSASHEWRAVINARAIGNDCTICRKNNRGL